MGTAHRWVAAGMAGMTLFLVALLALHVLVPLSGTPGFPENSTGFGQPRHISAYALTPLEPLWFVGVLLLGVGMMAFAFGLWRMMPRAKHSLLVCVLLFFAGVAVLFLDVFHTDPTPIPTTVAGTLHDVAAIASLTLQCAAMVLLTETGARSPAWQKVVGSSPAPAAIATILSIAWGFLDIMPEKSLWTLGVVMQRVLAVYMVWWMLGVGLRLRWVAVDHAARSASGTPSS